MSLRLPPAITIKGFTGGFRAVADYTDLADTETNDAQDIVYGLNENLDSRPGCLKMLNERLLNTTTLGADTGTFSAGQGILGHYWYDKVDSSNSFHVVAAGGQIYNYTSSTAIAIRTQLSANTQSFYTFVQMRNPNSASSDMLLMANGVDPIQVWNGTATCVALSSLTSASAVPVASFILEHHQRVIAMGIVDATDVRAANRIDISGFGADGNPDPHRFSVEAGGGSIFCGSGKHGRLQCGSILQNQLIAYTRKSAWRIEIGSSGILDISNVQEIERSVGVLAPLSLISTGAFDIFLSEQGVYAFDGSNFVHLSKDVDEEIFMGNTSQLQFAKGLYFKKENQYRLYYPSAGSNRNDRCLVYDLREGMKLWQPPITGREVSFASTYDSNGIEEIIYGDYVGYLYQDNQGDNDGLVTGYNGTVTAASSNTVDVSEEGGNSLPTTNDGLSGLMIHIIGGTGAGQSRVIASNTGSVVTVETVWSTQPGTDSTWSIGGIQSYWRSKDFDFGQADIVKLFRHIRVRPREEGNFNLTMYYIVDFRQLEQATSVGLSLIETSGVWDVSRWDQARFGALPVITRKVSLRNTDSQRLNGTHLGLRFSNLRANEKFRITGFDLEIKSPRGKR